MSSEFCNEQYPSSEYHRACERGDIEAAKQELLKEEKRSDNFMGYAFTRACFEGHLELAKWILDMNPSKSIISHRVHMPIMEACRNNKAEVAEWIVSLKPYLYSVKYLKHGKIKATIINNRSTFCDACYDGDLETAKRLLIAKPKMDISKTELNKIFGEACLKGFLELAQWLLSVKPDIDISAKKDFALKSALENGHTEIVAWLTELKA